MNLFKIPASRFLFCCALLLFSSCSGTGEGGKSSSSLIGLSPLLVPEKVSVVDPTSQAASGKPLGAAKLLLTGITGTDLAAATDYQSDTPTVFVNERSLEAFDTVNSILCTIRQTRYDKMINKGPYKAQIDTSLCTSDRSNASSAGQSSTDQSGGAAMPKYEIDTVNSFRATAQSPQIIEIWAHPQPKPGEQKQVIYGKAVITEGADTTPPYGIFTINFESLDANDLSTVLFTGLLNAQRDPATGKVLLYFALEDQDSYVIQKATLDKDPVLGTGAGSVLNVISYPTVTPTATRFDLAYNLNNFLRKDNSGPTVCLDRINHDESTWKYGLYTAQTPTGTRVNLNAGFPVRKGSDYGWIGYWGTWFPDGTTLSSGDVVFKHDYALNTDTAYTVLKSGGRLKQYTRNNTTLGGIKNVPLIWWDSSTGTTITYLIVWDGANFTKIAQQDDTGAWQSITSPTALDLTALPWIDFLMWSQSLNGMVIIHLPVTGSCTQYTTQNGQTAYDCSKAVSNLSNVTFYKEDILFPTDPVPSNLACFDNCPDVVSIATATPYRTDIASYQTVTPTLATYASYSFDTSTMALLDTRTTTSVYLTVPNPSYSGGVSSGPLFDPNAIEPVSKKTYLDLLACDWDPGSTCGGKAWTVLPVFYVWETGPNSWNQFTMIKDSFGKPVKFDAPLQVRYTHSDGRTFFLQYNGFGDLQGIPGKCVNLDYPNQLNVDCSQGATNPAIRWVPEFNIPDTDAFGNLTEVYAGTTPYIVKALEKEERMGTGSDCSALTSQIQAYDLPSMRSWRDPAIGPEPVITYAPAVIGGVVQ